MVKPSTCLQRAQSRNISFLFEAHAAVIMRKHLCQSLHKARSSKILQTISCARAHTKRPNSSKTKFSNISPAVVFLKVFTECVFTPSCSKNLSKKSKDQLERNACSHCNWGGGFSREGGCMSTHDYVYIYTYKHTYA